MAGRPTQASGRAADQRLVFGGGVSGVMSRAFGKKPARGCQDASTMVTGMAMLCRAGASAAGQQVAATARAALWWLCDGAEGGGV